MTDNAYGMQTFYLDQIYYYIHRRYEHFEEAGDLLQTLTEQKEQFYSQTMQRFKQNYITSINTKSFEALDMAMQNEDEFIETIDKTLGEQLNSIVSTSLQSFNLENMISQAYNALDKVIENKDAQSLDELFKIIEEATNILEDSEAKTALLIILQNRKNYSRFGDFANYITKEIKKMDKKLLKSNYSTINSVLTSLQNLANRLKGKKLNKQVLQGYIKNIFSTNFGEYAVQKALGNLAQDLDRTIEEGLLGAKNVTLTNDRVIEFWKQYGSKSKTHKVDNALKNFNIQIGEEKNSILIDLGISTKWYKGGGDASGVSITSETNFQHRLNQIFTNQNMYSIYNGLALAGQDASIYHALKAVIIARNIDTMLSGLGVAAGDFAQFIVINGKFYSIYDILKAIEYHNEGQGSYDEENGTDIVTISAKGLSKVINYTEKANKEKNKNLEKAFERSKIQNELLRNLELSGHFYPQRLISLG